MVETGQKQANPSEQISSLLTPDWVLIGASVQGSSHLLEGVSCQDRQAFRLSNECLLVTVADGLGTAAQAHEGAQLAVQAVIDCAEGLLSMGPADNESGWQDVLKASFTTARAKLYEEATRQNCDLNDFATTLIFAIISNNWLAAANIGDGAVVLLDEDDTFSTVCTPQNGEYANETFSITQGDALEKIAYQILPVKVKNLALLSDGLQRIAIHQIDASPHTPFFAPLFKQLLSITNASQAARSLANFLTSEKVRKLSGDDKTLLLIARKQAVS